MKKRIALNKPNELISVLPKESISLIQQKCYNIFLRNAQRKIKFNEEYEEINDKTRYVFEISCSQLEKSAGLNKKDYAYIKEELEKLLGIVITVVDKENKSNWKMFHFLNSVEKEGDVFRYSLDWMIMKALEGQSFFTQLDLLQVAKLDSKYSVILYELAIRYQNYKIPKMSVEEFRKRTNTQDKYSNFTDFRKRVLDKACEEISEKTDIKLSYSTEKRGRRIAFIDFEIERKKEEVPVEVKVKEKKYSKEVLELFAILPLKEQVEANKRELEKLLKEHSFEYIKGDIEYVKGAKPDNFFGFLKSSCESGHYAVAQMEKKKPEEELARKKKEEEKRKKELEEKIIKKAAKKAKERYESLSSERLDKYLEGYDMLPDFVRSTMSKERYVLGALEEEIREELEDLLFN
ncbi:replication initiation protein [Halonatronum saccharophilum]|uniref:replication initiation protein n=1 Tax=Halonatronum saccharophilum TaxID=150060 RepID=UPI000488A017|nr:replication initiation protein [Halonatronum saccharophilum]